MAGSPAVTPPAPPPPPADITWLTLPEVAERLGVGVSRIHQLRRDRQLLALRRNDGWRVPERFLDDGVVVKHLPGVLTLLADGGFSDEEAVEWLFAEQPALPGTPIQALQDNRATEVKRRAQASAL